MGATNVVNILGKRINDAAWSIGAMSAKWIVCKQFSLQVTVS